MRLFVPHTKIQPATRIALRSLSYVAYPVTDYVAYWRERWVEGQTFISVEPDVVPWPGALEALDACPEPWCAYAYAPNEVWSEGGFPYLGCVKFSAAFIAATPHIWDGASDWRTLDLHLADRAPLPVHQHFPPVVNANPILLGD